MSYLEGLRSQEIKLSQIGTKNVELKQWKK